MSHNLPERNGLTGFLLRYRWHFLLCTLAAFALRIVFLVKFPLLTDDSFVYGDIAKNWLQHAVYGQSGANGPEATFIRLPGYPIVLALTWVIAGVEHYHAVLSVQILVDVLTCFLVADLARRIASERAARTAFVIAALCPFFANYAAVALTETWAIFFAALAMDAAVAAFDTPSHWKPWTLCGVALAGGILLRPDGGILLIVIGGYSLLRAASQRSRQIAVATALMGVIALAPLAPWTIRNWRTFHLVQPLTSIDATMPDEFVPHGFQRWERTWIADYTSVEDVSFKVNGDSVSVDDLPLRAFDDSAQRQRTAALWQSYAVQGNVITPALDEEFAALARERIRSHPLRFYFGLPLLRAVGLWLRPRTEMLPLDQHWWRLWNDDRREFGWAIILGAINLLYIAGAAIALFRGQVRYAALFLVFAVIRTAFLSWMPNPEPRYVLECYPALLAIGAAAVQPRRSRTHRAPGF